MSDIKVIKLTQPPQEHELFPRIDCEADQGWSSKVIESIRKGARVMLANCKENSVESIKGLCKAQNYVALVLPYPNFGEFCRIYFQPDRRQGRRPRALPAT